MNNGFKYFPKDLYSKPVKMIAALSSAIKTFGMSRPSEIFFTIKNGNWNDVSVWQTVSGRVGKLPTANDDVYIKHSIFIPSNIPMSCFNLFITGEMSATFQIFATEYAVRVFGDFKCDGAISGINIWLYGNNTFINRQKNPSNNQFSIRYASSTSQPIFPMDYWSLGIATGALGAKYLIGNTTCQSYFGGGGSVTSLEMGHYDFTCFGVFTNYFLTSCSGNGYLLFIGAAAFHGRTSITGAPTIEFRGGVGPMMRSGLSATGFGQILFTTNNQSYSNVIGELVDIDCPVTISSGITLTINSATVLQFNKTINGSDGASSLINKGTINFGTLESVSSMTTGTFDRTNFANTVGYTGNYSATIPFSTFSSLNISGTGTKTLGANTTVNVNLTSTGILDCSTYDLTVNGTTNTQGGKLTKSGAGNVLFVGNLIIGNALASIDFSVGNPTVELRGGMGFSNSNPSAQAVRSGTGVWTFTTNSQTIRPWSTIYPMILDCPIIISGAITVTITQSTGTGGALNLNNTINGNSVSSTLVVGTSSVLTFATAASVPSMTTGIFDRSTFANTVAYSGNYSATMPSYFTTFSSLVIAGTGTKTLGVNTTINAGLSVTSSGTFDLGAYNIDVIGQTTITTANLNKTGSGSVLFRGLLLLSNSAQPKLNFSGGNPTVELRAGMQYGNGNDPLNSGTGQWSFTTANQEIRHISGIGPTINFNCPILIASGITVTVTSTFPFTSIAQFNNSVNGVDGTSKLTSSNNSIYLSNISFPQPMTTGIFDITTNANTLGYAFNGNYTLPYTAFSNLQVFGTGTKSLSGNTTFSGGLTIFSNGVFEASIYNLTVIGGASTVGSTSTLSKNGAGSIVLGSLNGNINFSGNPTVEIKGGMSVGNQNVFDTGTGQWTFSTSNQSIVNIVGNTYTPTFRCPILVSGITLTMQSNFIPQTFIFTGLLDGSDAVSTFRMGTGTPTVSYRNATQPMATGVLDTSTNANTWIYGLNNQDIKGSPTISPKQVYRNLTLNGTGVKTLQGYCSVLNTYTLTAPASVNLNGFTLTNP